MIPGQQQIEFPPHNGRDTSIEAAASMKEHAPAQRQRVLDAIRATGKVGCIRDQLERGLGLGGNSVHPRVLELIRDKQIVELVDVYRKTAKGRRAHVLVAMEHYA